jgi:radical SAM superfamily enzyme YgiQ (UPF0313 family)
MTLKKAPIIKLVPMIGSLGCPYTCSFCIDAVVPYQMLDLDVMKDDLSFLLKKYKRPVVGWHDQILVSGSMIFLMLWKMQSHQVVLISLLKAACLSSIGAHLKRLKRNGFKAVLPGIESGMTWEINRRQEK